MRCSFSELVLRIKPVFEVHATDGDARAGMLRTTHGEVRTPVFMPVGTKATVKSLDPAEVRAAGAEILLGNTYHLHFRPGDELIRELGGLHRFMAWDGPILTDSGGFQVFSLRDTIARVDDDGVTFRNVYDGRQTRFTPELAAQIQANLGSDIAMCLDQVPPPGVRRRELEEAVRRTTLWAERQRHAARADGQLRFGITQGGVDPELRRRSTEEIAALEFDGNAIGGLAIGEDRDAMFETTDGRRLAASRPTSRGTSWGSATRKGSCEVIEAGIDMFDCVLPTRTARTGSALTRQGRLNLRNARFARDQSPARRALRLPDLHALHAGLHPPPRQPERAARPAPALAPQSTLLLRPHYRRARRDRARRRSRRTSANSWKSFSERIPDHRHPARRRVAVFLPCPHDVVATRMRRCRTGSTSATRSSRPAGCTAS